jgi:hypothetical protein
MKPVLLCALLAATALPLHASAAPAVGVEQAASAQFDLRTAGGAVSQVQLLASVPTRASTGAAPLLRVVVEAPDGTVTRYSAAVPASAVTVGTDAAMLRTTLGGVPLSVRWTLSQYEVVVSFGDAAAAADKQGGWTGGGQGAVAQVALGAVRCSVSGWLGDAVAHDTAEYGAPTASALRGVALKGASCATPPTSSVP